MRAIVFFLSALLTAVPALAADKIVKGAGGVEYVIPAGSLVGAGHFAGGADTDISATFDGKFVISGTFHVGGDGIVFLKPDKAVAAHLPHWKESGPPTQIWFENADAAERAIVPKAGGNSVAAHADRHVTLDVDHFTIHIECDTANYTVRFLSVHAPGPVAQEVEEEEGC